MTTSSATVMVRNGKHTSSQQQDASRISHDRQQRSGDRTPARRPEKRDLRRVNLPLLLNPPILSPQFVRQRGYVYTASIKRVLGGTVPPDLPDTNTRTTSAPHGRACPNRARNWKNLALLAGACARVFVVGQDGERAESGHRRSLWLPVRNGHSSPPGP
jgi:hypothetical protein